MLVTIFLNLPASEVCLMHTKAVPQEDLVVHRGDKKRMHAEHVCGSFCPPVALRPLAHWRT